MGTPAGGAAAATEEPEVDCDPDDEEDQSHPFTPSNAFCAIPYVMVVVGRRKNPSVGQNQLAC